MLTNTPPCPRCGTPNPRNLRFCRKCGQFVGEGVNPAATAAPPAAPPPQSWWSRFRERWTLGATAAARSSYRQSLPTRYRLVRTASVSLILTGLLVAWFATGNPVDWVKSAYWTLTDTVEPVPGVTATAVPDDPTFATDPADAVDPDVDSAWSTPWSEQTQASGPPECGQTLPGTQSLVLSWDGIREIRELRVTTGVVGDQHDLQWVPVELQLSYPNLPDERCKTVTLTNQAEEQPVEIDAVDTDAIMFTVVSADGRPGQVTDIASLTKIEVDARPQ